MAIIIAPEQPSEAFLTRQRAMVEASKAWHEKMRSQTTILADGVKVYPDTEPGVGWVLSKAGKPKRYLGTKELAIAHYNKLVADGTWLR